MASNRVQSENREVPPAFLLPDEESFRRYDETSSIFSAIGALPASAIWQPSGGLVDPNGDPVTAYTDTGPSLLAIAAFQYKNEKTNSLIEAVESILLCSSADDSHRIAISVNGTSEYLFCADDITETANGLIDLYSPSPMDALNILAAFDPSRADPTGIFVKAVRATLFAEIPLMNAQLLRESGHSLLFSNIYGEPMISLLDSEDNISYQLEDGVIPKSIKNLPPLAFSFHEEKNSTSVHKLAQGVLLEIPEQEDKQYTENGAAILDIFGNALKRSEMLASIN